MTIPLYCIFLPLTPCVTSSDLSGSYPALKAVTSSYGLTLVNPSTVTSSLPPEPYPESLSLYPSPLSRTDIGVLTCELVNMTRRYVSDTCCSLCTLLEMTLLNLIYTCIKPALYLHQPYIDPPEVSEWHMCTILMVPL